MQNCDFFYYNSVHDVYVYMNATIFMLLKMFTGIVCGILRQGNTSRRSDDKHILCIFFLFYVAADDIYIA
jgi:hypothetical protein